MRAAPRADDDYAELAVADPFADGRPSTTVAERAMADRTWIYGHVVVDEAQELSRMAWHALSRRCSRRSMTVVGDLQQTTHPAGARDWDEALSWAGDRVDLHTLTVTYRITRQTADTATALLTRAGGTAPDLQPIREGAPTEHVSCTTDDLADVVLERYDPDAGRIGVIVPDDRAVELMAVLASADPRFGTGDEAIDSPIAVLTARDAKGLEFDHVFVVSPGRDRHAGASGIGRLRRLHPRHPDPSPRRPVITRRFAPTLTTCASRRSLAPGFIAAWTTGASTPRGIADAATRPQDPPRRRRSPTRSPRPPARDEPAHDGRGRPHAGPVGRGDGHRQRQPGRASTTSCC